MNEAWSRATEPVRDALSVLSMSDAGWRWTSLRRVFGWSEGITAATQRDLERLHLTVRDYTRGQAQEAMTDWLVRAAVREPGRKHFQGDRLARLTEALEGDADLHRGDLGLVVAALDQGLLPALYLERSLPAALRRGQYEAVLALWKRLQEPPWDGIPERLWGAALRSAQRLGRFADEVAILRHGLSRPVTVAEEVTHRRQLAAALFALGDWAGAVGECEAIEGLPGVPEVERVRAVLQRAEFLWQAGRFDEADAVYAEVEPSLGADPGLLLQFHVGRARLAGQRGDTAAMGENLRWAEKQVSSQIRDQDLLYLNASVGYAIEVGRQHDAVGIATRALELAERDGRWKEFVMLAARASAVTYELGSAVEAHRDASRALATAVALRSRKMIAMTSLFLGFYEVRLGQIGTALRRAKQAIELAKSLQDGMVVVETQRLRAFIGGMVGLQKEVEESRDVLMGYDDPKFRSHSDECMGTYALGASRWEEAQRYLSEASDAFRHSGQSDSLQMAQAKLALALHGLGKDDHAATVFDEASDYFEAGRFPLMMPMVRMIGIIIGRTDPAVFPEVIDDLAVKRRWLEIARWGGLALKIAETADRRRLGRVVLSAVQFVASSFDDPAQRKEFLGYSDTVNALQAVKESVA